MTDWIDEIVLHAAERRMGAWQSFQAEATDALWERMVSRGKSLHEEINRKVPARGSRVGFDGSDARQMIFTRGHGGASPHRLIFGNVGGSIDVVEYFQSPGEPAQQQTLATIIGYGPPGLQRFTVAGIAGSQATNVDELMEALLRDFFAQAIA